jgi:hypothetical protein
MNTTILLEVAAAVLVLVQAAKLLVERGQRGPMKSDKEPA